MKYSLQADIYEATNPIEDDDDDESTSDGDTDISQSSNN